MDQLGQRLTFGPNPLRGIEEGRGRGRAGAGGRGRLDNVSLCAGASGVTGAWASGNERADCTRDVATWRSGPCPRQPACLTRTSMPRYRMTPSRSRPRPGPALRGAVRLPQPGSGGKGARSKPHTFAQRAFAGAELRAHCRLPSAKMALTLRTLRQKRGGCGGVVAGGPQGLTPSQSML